MPKKGLFSLVIGIGIMCGANSPANAAITDFNATKVSHIAMARAVRTLENEKDKIFIILMNVGRRCINKDEICRFYYRGYYYETPWWTAPAIY